jgi:hypothetical protein
LSIIWCSFYPFRGFVDPSPSLLSKCWDRFILLVAKAIVDEVIDRVQETFSWTKVLTWLITFLHLPFTTRWLCVPKWIVIQIKISYLLVWTRCIMHPSSSPPPERRSVILHIYSTQNQQRPYQKLSEKWLLITSLSGCSLEQKLPSSVTHSPNRTRPDTPFLMSAILGLRSALECRNLISSNSFAHRVGTWNSALRLTPGPIGLKPELRHRRSEFIYLFIYKMHDIIHAS